MAAYGEAISTTSTPWAPWYVVPTNRRWYRDYVLSSVIVDDARRASKCPIPSQSEDLEGVVVEVTPSVPLGA